MKALDFTATRPRGPRVRLAGVVFTARVIDKLRASLPGGDLNGYFENAGFSRIWRQMTKISLTDLREHIVEAPNEAAVVAWIDTRLTENGVNREGANTIMEGVTTALIPAEWREVFEQTYPAELRERHPNAFDLFEADDERLYADANHS